MKRWTFFSMGLLFATNVFATDDIRTVLGDLEKNMRKVESMQTSFTQTKHIKMFKEPVTLQGRIFMQKPEQFAWFTDSPLQYALVFEKDKIYQWNEDSGKVETLSFKAVPVLRMVSEQMQSWFYGAYGEMLDQYDVTRVNEQPLTLKFVPREKSVVHGMVGAVTIRLKDDKTYIESILIEETNGDRSEMEFKDTVLNAAIDPAVWKLKNRAA